LPNPVSNDAVIGADARCPAAYGATFDVLVHDDGFASVVTACARRGQFDDHKVMVASNMLQQKAGVISAAKMLAANSRLQTNRGFEAWMVSYQGFRSPCFQAADLERLSDSTSLPECGPNPHSEVVARYTDVSLPDVSALPHTS
jgi:hypothetical protein